MTKVGSMYVFAHNDGDRIVLVGRFDDGPDYAAQWVDADDVGRRFWAFTIVTADEWSAALTKVDRYSYGLDLLDDCMQEQLGDKGYAERYRTRSEAITAALAR